MLMPQFEANSNWVSFMSLRICLIFLDSAAFSGMLRAPLCV